MVPAFNTYTKTGEMYLEEKLVAVRTFLRFLFLVQKKKTFFKLFLWKRP